MIEVIAPYVSAYGDDEAIANALIAAGIGDVLEEKSKAFVYANEIAYLDNQLKEYKHRAEVAEKALNKACADMEAVRKQAVEEFAERVQIAFHYEFDGFIPSIMAKYFTESRARD